MRKLINKVWRSRLKRESARPAMKSPAPFSERLHGSPALAHFRTELEALRAPSEAVIAQVYRDAIALGENEREEVLAALHEARAALIRDVSAFFTMHGAQTTPPVMKEAIDA